MLMLRRIVGIVLVAVPLLAFVALAIIVAIEIPVVRWTALVVAAAYGMVALGFHLIDTPPSVG